MQMLKVTRLFEINIAQNKTASGTRLFEVRPVQYYQGHFFVKYLTKSKQLILPADKSSKGDQKPESVVAP